MLCRLTFCWTMARLAWSEAWTAWPQNMAWFRSRQRNRVDDALRERRLRLVKGGRRGRMRSDGVA